VTTFREDVTHTEGDCTGDMDSASVCDVCVKRGGQERANGMAAPGLMWSVKLTRHVPLPKM
jgi:hypothetical protein